jgi:predicted RNase H-like HicB family nuclease
MDARRYKIVVYRQEDGWWVAEIPSLPACYALMPTQQEAIQELNGVFDMVAEEYEAKGLPLPEDSTQVIHA